MKGWVGDSKRRFVLVFFVKLRFFTAQLSEGKKL